MKNKLPFLAIMVALSACNTKQDKVERDSVTDSTSPQVVDTIQGGYGLDFSTLSDRDLFLKPSGTLPDTKLVNDMVDAYNSFTVLNSVICDYELWDRELNENAPEAIRQLNCSTIKDDGIRLAAQRYRDNVLSIITKDSLRADTATFDRVSEECGTYYSDLVDRFNVTNYGELTVEIYQKNYDKDKRIPDSDIIVSLRETDSLRVQYLKEQIEKATDFDLKCIYSIEYAHTDDTEAALMQLKSNMQSGQYSIYLYETWRYWRCLMQDWYGGASKDSEILNNTYNEMRRVCANTVLNYIVKHPKDIMAINQFIVMSAHSNIYRYGEFPLGNQNMMEMLELFPERFESSNDNACE